MNSRGLRSAATTPPERPQYAPTPEGSKITPVHTVLDEWGAAWVPMLALATVGVGVRAALRGPYVRHVDIPVEGLSPDLDGLRNEKRYKKLLTDR